MSIYPMYIEKDLTRIKHLVSSSSVIDILQAFIEHLFYLKHHKRY